MRLAVLVTLRVCGDGRKVIVDLRLAGNESAEAWGAVLPSLVERHLGVPELAVTDGSAGFRSSGRS